MSPSRTRSADRVLARLSGPMQAADPLRLYLFPHAGGSASDYAGWADMLPGVEVIGIQLPGRAARYSEPSVPDVRLLAREVADAVETDRPFVLFGHSFGALLAYETCLALRSDGRRVPDQLWVSAFPAPDRIPQDDTLHELPARELLERLSGRFGAIPDEVLANDELVDIVAEYVRADYRALETYCPAGAEPLDLELFVLTARDDYSSESDSAGWRPFACGGFESHQFDGGHFYLRDRANLATICTTLLEATRSLHDVNGDQQ